MNSKNSIINLNLKSKHYLKNGYDIQEENASLYLLKMKNINEQLKITKKEFESFINAKESFSILVNNKLKTFKKSDVIGYSMQQGSYYSKTKAK